MSGAFRRVSCGDESFHISLRPVLPTIPSYQHLAFRPVRAMSEEKCTVELRFMLRLVSSHERFRGLFMLAF